MWNEVLLPSSGYSKCKTARPLCPKSGHVQCTTQCLLGPIADIAPQYRKTASVAVLAKSDQVYRLVTAVAFFHCEANRAAHAILKNLGGDFVAWLSSSSE